MCAPSVTKSIGASTPKRLCSGPPAANSCTGVSSIITSISIGERVRTRPVTISGSPIVAPALGVSMMTSPSSRSCGSRSVTGRYVTR